ncbi:MAG TPA: amidohydrolase family protein [Gemmatimonadaceae bacterium]|nr:amidohydrolase family protein [Gemmatimonadaceae bacterium]
MTCTSRSGVPSIAIAAIVACTTALPAQTIAITGGRVFPVGGAPIDNGTVLIRDGRITAVGSNVTVPDGAERIDATGKWVTPGLINAATQLGLVEIGLVADTRQTTARGDGDAIAAAFTVWDGLNPNTVLIEPTRNEGITSVVVLPQGGLISGQAALIDLVDGSAADMLVQAPVAMVGQVGAPAQANMTARGELIVRLRELLEDTRAYMRRKGEFERAATRPFVASRLDLEAMIPVVQGRLPLMVQANMASDIEAALRLARENELRIIIAGGAEAWMLADRIAAARVPVMTGALDNLPSSFATLGARQENAAILRQAGVEVIIVTGGGPESFNVRNVKQEAGNAVAYGMSWDDALRAVTLAPATALGVSDRLGTLAPGRVANVVVWSGDPFELSTRAEHVFVRGRRLTTRSRQDMLTDRYKTLPPRYSTP